eukprot:TCONS_00069157-protein
MGREIRFTICFILIFLSTIQSNLDPSHDINTINTTSEILYGVPCHKDIGKSSAVNFNHNSERQIFKKDKKYTSSQWVMQLRLSSINTVVNSMLVIDNSTVIEMFLDKYRVTSLTNTTVTTSKLQSIFSHIYDISITCASSTINEIAVKVQLIDTKIIGVNHKHIQPKNEHFLHTSPIGYFTSFYYPFGYKYGSRVVHKIKTFGKHKIIHIHFMDVQMTQYGFVCSSHDDNLRIRGSDQLDERFEYADTVGYTLMCHFDTPYSIEVSGYEYIFIQFNALHSTIAHRGYAIGYEIKDDVSKTNPEVSKARIIMATIVGIVFGMCLSTAVIVIVLYRKRKRKVPEDPEEMSKHTEDELSGDNTKNDENYSSNTGDEDSRQSVDICEGGTSRDFGALNGLNLEHLQRLNKLFSSTVAADGEGQKESKDEANEKDNSSQNDDEIRCESQFQSRWGFYKML